MTPRAGTADGSTRTPRTGGGREAARTLGLLGRRRRTRIVLAVLMLALLGSAVLGLCAGAVTVAPGETARILAGHVLPGAAPGTQDAAADAIIWRVRAPRLILALCVGAGLAVTGTALQAMVRNVLADPHLLGISAGASTGAAAALLFGVGLGASEHALQVTAFLGALIAALLVTVLARVGGRMTAVRLLLAGVAVGYGLNAVTSFLVFASGSAEGTRSVMFWLLGSLALAQWGTPLLAVVIVTVLTAAVLFLLARMLDALAAGDETARSLGVPPEAARLLLLAVVSLCIGVLVAASGAIGFVGLTVPHLARRLVGSAHAAALPVAALLGAVLVVLADAVARVVLQPQELPIGVVTAAVGTPFLLLLIRRMRA